MPCTLHPAPCLHHTGKVFLCLCCHCHRWLCNLSTAWYCCCQKFWQVTAEMTWRCRSKRSKTTYLKDCMEIIGNQICYAGDSSFKESYQRIIRFQRPSPKSCDLCKFDKTQWQNDKPWSSLRRSFPSTTVLPSEPTHNSRAERRASKPCSAWTKKYWVSTFRFMF